MKIIELKHKYHNEKITYWGVKNIYTHNGIMQITFDEKNSLRVIKDTTFYDIEIKEE